MHISTFRGTYGTSPRRESLINLLETVLSDIDKRGWLFRAFVFGSMLKITKDQPGDIDLLLCVSVPMNDHAAERPKNTNRDIQILQRFVTGDFSTPTMPGKCYDLNAMVAHFNAEPANIAKGISITAADCIEVTL